MIFYYAPQTVAIASHIALEEAGAVYEARRLDFGKTEQRSPEYLKVNPKGRVPALVTERGIITETPAILVFIAQSYPAAKLARLDDPFEFARLQSFNNYLCSTVHVAHAHKVRGSRWVDDPQAIEELKKKVTRNMADSFELIEKEFFRGPWVMGEDYSIGDPYLYTVSRWLAGDGVDINSFPQVADHHQRMLGRAAVQKITALQTATAPAP